MELPIPHTCEFWMKVKRPKLVSSTIWPTANNTGVCRSFQCPMGQMEIEVGDLVCDGTGAQVLLVGFSFL